MQAQRGMKAFVRIRACGYAAQFGCLVRILRGGYVILRMNVRTGRKEDVEALMVTFRSSVNRSGVSILCIISFHP